MLDTVAKYGIVFCMVSPGLPDMDACYDLSGPAWQILYCQMQNLIPSWSVKFQTPGPVCCWATSVNNVVYCPGELCLIS